eukprot:CAMPEP_0183436746 /NCGR_PEP_ID=MMETSP0370-20130417/69967_1 /TAXON_ID=268820 /ORGANISM="Peridinium aciculiferum, Strain PAER-2" /LENGTH=99 /DNA_ID=CAMNT_0025624293 /DNA_START=95 /DNA_END=392 /DNA_ORIENTATION=+
MGPILLPFVWKRPAQPALLIHTFVRAPQECIERLDGCLLMCTIAALALRHFESRLNRVGPLKGSQLDNLVPVGVGDVGTGAIGSTSAGTQMSALERLAR